MKRKTILNEKLFAEEADRIESVADKREAQYRRKMLRRISDLAGQYQRHVQAYDALHAYPQKCREICARGLRFSSVEKEFAASKWDDFFASNLSDDQKESIYYNDFKWHVFSFEAIPCKTGKEAQKAFNRVKKRDAYIFIQCTDEAWYIENADLLTAADLALDSGHFDRRDIYIFDAQGKWTYVRTHESECGPYFTRGK